MPLAMGKDIGKTLIQIKHIRQHLDIGPGFRLESKHSMKPAQQVFVKLLGIGGGCNERDSQIVKSSEDISI